MIRRLEFQCQTIIAILGSTLLFICGCYSSYRLMPRPGDIQDLGLIIPVQGVTTLDHISPFGDTRQHGRRLHTGIDIFAQEGTPVLAPQEGTIVRMSTGRTAGNYIYLLDFRGDYLYEFLHLQRFDSGIRMDETVKQGQVIGYVGKTGNARNGPSHLHFAIARLFKKAQYKGKKRYLDPVFFFEKESRDPRR